LDFHGALHVFDSKQGEGLGALVPHRASARAIGAARKEGVLAHQVGTLGQGHLTVRPVGVVQVGDGDLSASRPRFHGDVGRECHCQLIGITWSARALANL